MGYGCVKNWCGYCNKADRKKASSCRKTIIVWQPTLNSSDWVVGRKYCREVFDVVSLSWGKLWRLAGPEKTFRSLDGGSSYPSRFNGGVGGEL